MLFGEYNHQVDAKGRIRLPSKFKSVFSPQFIVTLGDGGCLYVFSKDAFEEYKKKKALVPLGDKAAQLALRMFFANAYDVEEDAQGRFVLPVSLRKKVDIDKNIIIIGVGDRAEIWDKETYENLMNSMSFDKALEKLADYGI